ncbi:hypothetical protein [Acidiphilium cryptum]
MEAWSLFGLSQHLERLSKIGDPLEVLEATVDFEHFRGWLVEGLGYGDGARGGRPPFDPVFDVQGDGNGIVGRTKQCLGSHRCQSYRASG